VIDEGEWVFSIDELIADDNLRYFLINNFIIFVVLLIVHHGTLRNQHQLDTHFLVCLLGVSASTCFGRYSPIFRRLCTNAVWCNCVQVAVEPQSARIQHTSYARNYTK
jgi:hypothetical protein